MSEFTQENRDELLAQLRKVLPDVQYSKQSWMKNSIDFQDECGCYSEWTTENCCLTVAICGTVPNSASERSALYHKLEDATERYARAHLSWTGCECCGDGEDGEEAWLNIDIRLYSKDAEETNAF